MPPLVLTHEIAAQHKFFRCKEIGMSDYFIAITKITETSCEAVSLDTGQTLTFPFNETDSETWLQPATEREIFTTITSQIATLQAETMKLAHKLEDLLNSLSRMLANTPTL